MVEEQKKPWTIQRPLHLSLNSAQQKYALVPAGKEESCRVASYYAVCPAPGYEIDRIDIVFNPRMIQEFELYLSRLQEKENNLAFMPDWQKEDEKAGKSRANIAWRTEIDASLKALAAPYTVSAYPSVQILPLWHGTDPACLDSIFRVGYANLSTTDEGYFGRGIYGTPEPRYAKEVYSAGSLLLNWVGFFAAYPVMDGDMPKLKGKANYKQYDAHFVPVVPASNDPDEKKYYPTKPKEPFTYRELVVFQSAACLPWGIISLQPHALKLTQITFDSLQAENINAPLDESGNTLLHQAIKQNKPHEHIQTLMDVGADYKTRNQKGERPIDFAPKETQLFMERYHKTLKNLTLQRTKGRLSLLEQRIADLESRQLLPSAQSDTVSSDQPPSSLTPFSFVKK